MLELHKESLRLTATYGLIIAASVILFGASVGRWIDKTRRLTAAKTFLTIQNTAVSICALLLAGFISYKSEIDEDNLNLVTAAVSVGAIILASIARLASSGTNIIIQKDWIVVIAGEDSDLLAKMNSILRTIELTTYMLAPAAAGQLFTFCGFGLTGLIIAGWNIISVCLEYLLLALIYKKYPALGQKRNKHIVSESQEISVNDGSKEKESRGLCHGLMDAVEGWKTYFNHPVMKAGLGLACLFMTVLGFDNITYGYCLMQGVPHVALGLLVGVSALVGVAGSLAYPAIRRCVGLERTGLLGMFLLVSCSSLALLSIILPGSPMDLGVLFYTKTTNSSLSSEVEITLPMLPWTMDNVTLPEFWLSYCSVLVFLAGIILARFGLWIVDLTVNQLLQEKVQEEVRGVVNGVQDSLNNSLDLAKCILVIMLPAEETFGLLIIASFTSVSLGWLLYALYSRQQRGHLFHFQRLAASLSCIPHQQQQQPDKEVNEEKEKMLEKGEEERAVVVKKIEKRKKGEVCSV